MKLQSILAAIMVRCCHFSKYMLIHFSLLTIWCSFVISDRKVLLYIYIYIYFFFTLSEWNKTWSRFWHLLFEKKIDMDMIQKG